MNIRGKTSPAQNTIRTVNAPASRVPTATPPPQQLTVFSGPGAQFEEAPQHYQYQAVAASYQQPPQYVDMNKPAPGRVAGPGLPQAPQPYANVPRAQPVSQQYGQLVPDATEQSVSMYPQQNIYIPAAPQQNMRQQRMPAMNSSQVSGQNMAYMMNLPYMPYAANQMQFVPNAGQSFVYPQQQQQRMPPYQPMPSPTQINYMTFQPTSFPNPYQAPGMPPFQAGINPLPMGPARPASIGVPGAMGPGPKMTREKKAIPIVNPETMTPIIVAPEHVSDEHHSIDKPPNPVAMEFTRKVALMLEPEHSQYAPTEELQHAEQVASHGQIPAMSVQLLPGGQQIVNGEADIREPRPMECPEFSLPSEVELPVEQPVETVFQAAYAGAPGPYPSSAPAPVAFVPEPVADVTNIVVREEKLPEVTTEDEPSLPATVPVEIESQVKMASTTVTAAAAASIISDAAATVQQAPEPSPAAGQPPMAQSQATGPPPQPQRQDTRKGKKKNKDFNKKSKEGSDMDAFYDSQAGQESSETVETAPPQISSTARVAPVESAPEISLSPKESFAPKETVVPPKATVISPETVSLPKETVSPPKETVSPPKETVSPPKEIVSPPKEIVSLPKETFSPAKEAAVKEATVITKEAAPMVTSVPCRETVTSAKETTVPSKVTTAPIKDISAKDKVTVAKEAAVVVPPMETCAPSKDTAAPVRETSIPKEKPGPVERALSAKETAAQPVAATAAKEATRLPETLKERSPAPSDFPVATPSEAEPSKAEEEQPEGAATTQTELAAGAGSAPASDMLTEDEDDGSGAEAAPAASSQSVRQPMINGVQLNYREGQWSPMNPEGKKQYDRDFLLKLQANPESRKPPNLPDIIPDIFIDPRLMRPENLQNLQALSGRTGPDFTPGYFKSMNQPRPEFQSGGPGSMSKRNSQQGRRGGQISQGAEQRIIPSFIQKDISLHKSENAYTPAFKAQQAVAAEDTDLESSPFKTLKRQFQGILNKLTPEKYPTLLQKVMELKITNEQQLTLIAELMFEKAINESKFATQYAQLCKDMLKLPKVPKVKKSHDDPDHVTFRGVLLTKCQRQFESDKENEDRLERMGVELAEAPAEEKAKLEEVYLETQTKYRRRSLGNIRFIGELFKLKMLTENIMHDCIFKLLKSRDDDSLTCLNKLLDTVGKDLDTQKAKARMDQYFSQLEKLGSDMKISPRVRFGIKDTLDLRRNGWMQRKIHTQNKPTTLGEIHATAKQEQQEAQFLNSQPRLEPGIQGRTAGGGGAAGKGKGRGSMTGGDIDGWNTVPAKPVRQQIDASKMKLSKPTQDIDNVVLMPKLASWGRGSQGGGSRSQEQEKTGNRYNALNSLGDGDGHRGMGRSPARGDGRGDSRSGRGERDRDRRGDNRDRDFRKPMSRNSVEADRDRERAIASTRILLGGAGAGSNPSSRDASRDNSRTREVTSAVASAAHLGPDASNMTEDELDRRLNTIAEELHSNQSLKEAIESLQEIGHLDMRKTVQSLLEKLIEKPSKTRRLLGQLYFELLKLKIVTTEDIIGGISEFVQFGEDVELDVPKVWDNLSEVLASLLLQDPRLLPLPFLQPCVQPLQPNKRKMASLVASVLRHAAEYTSQDTVRSIWSSSGLQLQDFFIDDRDLKWLSVSPNKLKDGITSLLKHPRTDIRHVEDWIEKNFSREEVESVQFLRELTQALCLNFYNPDGRILDKSALGQAAAGIMRKYITSVDKGFQCLLAMQHLSVKLEHPPEFVQLCFEAFYDDEVIAEESYRKWWRLDHGTPEEMQGRGVVKMNVKSFYDWLFSSEASADADEQS